MLGGLEHAVHVHRGSALVGAGVRPYRLVAAHVELRVDMEGAVYLEVHGRGVRRIHDVHPARRPRLDPPVLERGVADMPRLARGDGDGELVPTEVAHPALEHERPRHVEEGIRGQRADSRASVRRFRHVVRTAVRERAAGKLNEKPCIRTNAVERIVRPHVERCALRHGDYAWAERLHSVAAVGDVIVVRRIVRLHLSFGDERSAHVGLGDGRHQRARPRLHQLHAACDVHSGGRQRLTLRHLHNQFASVCECLVVLHAAGGESACARVDAELPADLVV